SGNVDVTMSKNAYTDVATDASVNDIAKALDAGYTNNELFTSLIEVRAVAIYPAHIMMCRICRLQFRIPLSGDI
ncbi:hypothetical protein FV254_24015, partial [Escherichia coli]|uniref:hypothetical protein n=1 Tax=Escherichia coli TaxID=562 RepID=UPI0011CC1F45